MPNNDSDDTTHPYAPLVRGSIVGHYRIIEKIGAGGMGDVYVAEDTDLKRYVALKFLPLHLCQDADCRTRFKREAQAAARLDHPNIVDVHEVGEFQGRPFFSMQYIEGKSLRDLKKSTTFSTERIIDFGVQICEGLQKAHQAGIVHRDIKPGNILIDTDGRPRIADFGLARCQGGEPLTKTDTRIGTIGYMSPEQITGKTVDQRTDLFSLGIVLYEMITSRNPFAADNFEATQNLILTSTPEPLARYKSDVPPGLQNVIDRALEKDVAVRYQSAADMMADLRRLRRRTSDSTRRIYPSPTPQRARWMKIGYGALLVAVLLIAATIWLDLPVATRHHTAQNHLAIVPFTNLTGQATSQAFCDGLMETLTSSLTRLAESDTPLSVVPASEMRENNVRSASQARKRFGVNLVVTGSVQQLGDKIRTTLNLVDASTERQLRSTILDERKDNISLLQDESVAEVARLLDIQLRPESHRALSEGGTGSSEAFAAYLEGRGYLQRHDDPKSLDSALRYLNLAIKLDTNYALAYAGLGEVYWWRYNLTNDVSWAAPAIRYSSRALDLDDHQAPVLVTLGILHRATGQYQEAISYLKRALQVDSLNSETYNQLASAYEADGRVPEAETTFRRSIALRPNEWRNHYNLARFYAFRGQNDSALAQATTAESLAPEATFPYESIGSLYTFLGLFDRAGQLLERSLAIEPNYVAFSNLAAIYQMEGKYAKSEAAYNQSLALNDKDCRVWISLAGLYKLMPDGQEKSKYAYNRAIALAEKNREINPNDPALLCYLADCYWQIGARDKSINMAQQALQMAPDDIEVMVRAGIVFEEAGRRDQALALIGSAIRRGYSVDRIKTTDELRGLISDSRFDSLTSASR